MAHQANSLARARPNSRSLSKNLKRLKERARGFAFNAKSEATRRAYASDWRLFLTWCSDNELDSLPADPETVALFVTWLAEQGRKPSTIDRKLCAVSQAHKLSGLSSPTTDSRVRETLKGLKRMFGTAPTQKSPIVVVHLKRMLELLPDSLTGIRDRALLLVGFAGGFRRSELVAIDVSDLSFVPEGIVVLLRRSKTDQLGQGRKIGIPFGSTQETCPVRALRAWLEATCISEGPLFRSVNRHGGLGDDRLKGRAVARVVKRCAERAGYDPSEFAGHSLRSGLATAAAGAGKSERAIMRQTGHRSERVLRGYIRDGSLFSENAAEGLL